MDQSVRYRTFAEPIIFSHPYFIHLQGSKPWRTMFKMLQAPAKKVHAINLRPRASVYLRSRGSVYPGTRETLACSSIHAGFVQIQMMHPSSMSLSMLTM